jgi:NAD(P)-dependent dehydrogenase (short-subunit alcohol dehydrogenase family)
MFDLSDKTTIVTGAASGIGRAIAEQFTAAGASVIGVDVNRARLEALATEVAGVTPVLADIATPEGADQAIDAAADGLDVLCNNAAIIDGLCPIDEVSEERWHALLAVNLTGPFLLCRRAVPRMLERGGGCIVNIASVAGLRGGRAGAAYTASKFGLVGLTQNIAATHASRGIRCNAVCPGSTDTNIREHVQLSEAGMRIRTRDREKPPPATPAQIAAVVAFLATEAASRINGAALPVDGGFIAY